MANRKPAGVSQGSKNSLSKRQLQLNAEPVKGNFTRARAVFDAHNEIGGLDDGKHRGLGRTTGTTRTESTLPRGQLASLRREIKADHPDTNMVLVRSYIMAVRDLVLKLPTDDAILHILDEYLALKSRRAITKNDQVATLYLLAEVMQHLDDDERGQYLPLICETVGITPADAATDMGNLLTQGVLVDEDTEPPSLRQQRPIAREAPRPHWRDALDGIGKIRDYWRELASLGVHEVPLLTYGSGWSTSERSYVEELRHRNLTPAQGERVMAATRKLLDDVCRDIFPYYVAPPIGAMLEQAAESIPPTTMTRELLPSPVGMLWFGQRVDYTARADEYERRRFQFTNADLVKGVTVAPSMGHTGMTSPTQENLRALRSMGDLDTKPQLRAIVWHNAFVQATPAAPVTEGVCFSCYFEHQFPPDAPMVMFDFAHELSVVLDFGTVINPGLDLVVERSPEHYYAPGTGFLLNLWATALLFMRQQIVRPEATRVENKGARKSLSNKLKREVPDVLVVKLRQYAETDSDTDADAGAGERKIGKDFRFEVKGHWHQYRVGPQRRNLEPRFVAPYYKGDKMATEIRLKKKVAVLSR